MSSLKKFSGLEPITDNDPFWNQLLSFNFKPPENRQEQKQFEEATTDILEPLMYNTPTTGNFAAFVRVFLRRATELKTSAQCDDKIFLWQTANALIILRFCCQFFNQRLSEAEFAKMFVKNILNVDGKLEVVSDTEDPFESPMDEIINALVEIAVDLPSNDMTISVHFENLKCLLAVLCSELYRDKPAVNSKVIKIFMSGRCSIHAPLLTKTLLKNFLSHNESKPPSAFETGGSFVLGVAASMWNVIQWSTGVSNSTSDAEGEETNLSVTKSEANIKVYEPTVGGISLLLLLVLACQQHSEASHRLNPYRETLSAFQNAQEVSTLASPTQCVATFKLDYSALYERLCETVTGEPSMLLLYLLLHRNAGFRNYLLSRVNLENLVLPVLKVLHRGQSQKSSSHHVYLALIAVLILSEDDFFCKIIHETKLKSVDWYGDRPVSDISLGGLAILILAKTIQLNIIKTRDRYLHTNCLAALANMSAFFKDLPAVAAQKLVGLLEILTKRHAKLVDHIRLSAEYDLSQAQGQNAVHQQDITALEEGIRTLLEILNSCLTHGLRHNPHLIYTMLYTRQLFDAYQQHPMFQDLIWNISAVLNHFSARVNALDKGASVSQVLDVIEKGALQWPTDRLKKFPDLKFRYVEDDNTDDFFVPYVWTLVYKNSALYWDPTRIRLFNASSVICI